MTQQYVFNDSQLGSILFRHNPRAKKYIIRIKCDAISVTIPYGGNYQYAESFFKENRNIVLQKLTELQLKKQLESDFSKRSAQEYMLLHQKAVLFLPAELIRLAKEHGFSFRQVKISKSKTRWGSCSSKGTINLSFHLMLLPKHLIEYVLLHELCHTIEMNHSTAFWALLDKHTNGKARELRAEIRNYHIPNR